ncbi:DUF4249 family protein [Algoriphagus sp. H41]|uniref:DUF4249 family protein n=1 Tax=Algoriphagus oliviformis TaxID=2811231 RepID=A0ABS3C0F8_9BACT|nr:DUF4249 family protein [Algoriphagus oliviformis]MBN7810607.1 DUF4249 family protein [Algoriphagus oliviformis]
MKKRLIAYVILFVALSSCIDEIYLSVPASESNLVIDAWLGSTSEQSYVRVYRSGSYLSGSTQPNYTKVATTSIYVEDESGRRVYFPNTADTTLLHQPNAGQSFPAGMKYRVHVNTRDGAYESEWVLMPEPSTFGDFEAVAREKSLFVISGSSPVRVIGTTVDLTLQASNSSGEEVGYLIEADGISEVFTTGDAENCRCNCYLEEPLFVTGMNLGSGSDVPSPIILAELEVTSLGRFYLQSTIRTIPKANLDYLRQIDKQRRNTGSIFDPAPFKIRGNIKNLDNPDEEVLGNFMAYQEVEYNRMVYRADIYRLNQQFPFVFDEVGHVSEDCKDYYPFTLPYTPAPFQP